MNRIEVAKLTLKPRTAPVVGSNPKAVYAFTQFEFAVPAGVGETLSDGPFLLSCSARGIRDVQVTMQMNVDRGDGTRGVLALHNAPHPSTGAIASIP